MLGRKQYEEVLFHHFQLSDIIPADNFYRRLKDTLDLNFLYKMTAPCYGREGRKSIDPVVFFKLMLIGYIENQPSDRKIIEQASMRMDMLYFLGYNIGDPLPWHSTISRTRKLYGEELFLEVFQSVLQSCVSSGLVEGVRQAVDSAYVRAHASRDSITSVSFLETSTITQQPESSKGQDSRNSVSGDVPLKKRKYRYNQYHRSSTDPDARLSGKGKQPLALHYAAQISVDASSHVICGAMADFADKRDANALPAITGQTIDNLARNKIQVKEVLADANYSNLRSLKYLEERGITGYLPCHPNYRPRREGFTYCPDGDYYVCQAGQKLLLKSIRTDYRDGSQTKIYLSLTKTCKQCPFRTVCLSGKQYKHIEDTLAKPYYDRLYERMSTTRGKNMRKIRAATVEPVLGTLLLFRGMRRVYTKGISLANKHVLLAATAYNITKLIKVLFRKIAIPSINILVMRFLGYFKRIYKNLRCCLKDNAMNYYVPLSLCLYY